MARKHSKRPAKNSPRPKFRSKLTNGPRRGGSGKWISEWDVEIQYGIPRELTALWSGRAPDFPCTPEDRRIRRRVILGHYYTVAGLAKPTAGEPLINTRFAEALTFFMENRRVPHGHALSEQKAEEQAQTLALLLDLIVIDIPPSVSDADFPTFFWGMIGDDNALGPVTAEARDAEYERYYDGVGA